MTVKCLLKLEVVEQVACSASGHLPPNPHQPGEACPFAAYTLDSSAASYEFGFHANLKALRWPPEEFSEPELTILPGPWGRGQTLMECQAP